jgi:lysophospholipase L1-like esterase
MYRNEYATRTEGAVRTVKKLLLATARVARAHDVPLVIVMFPAREQVRPEAYSFAEDLDLDKPQRIYSRFFEENDIDYLDLLPALRERSPGDQLYYRDDVHWTPLGNKVVAEIIADYLTAEGALE